MANTAYLSRNEDMDKLDEKITGLVKKSKQTGVPYGILKRVTIEEEWLEDRITEQNTPHGMGFGRVNSMITGRKTRPRLTTPINEENIRVMLKDVAKKETSVKDLKNKAKELKVKDFTKISDIFSWRRKVKVKM